MLLTVVSLAGCQTRKPDLLREFDPQATRNPKVRFGLCMVGRRDGSPEVMPTKDPPPSRRNKILPALSPPAETGAELTYSLGEIAPTKAQSLLSCLDLRTVHSSSALDNAVLLTGPPEALHVAKTILDIIDVRQNYAVDVLASASQARSLPTNEQIAKALDHLTIGTFASPPPRGRPGRAIIDIYNRSVLVIAPFESVEEIHAIASLDSDAFVQKYLITEIEPQIQAPSTPQSNVSDLKETDLPATRADVTPRRIDPGSPTTLADTVISPRYDPNPQVLLSTLEKERASLPKEEDSPHTNNDTYRNDSIPNGDDILELDLPDKLNLTDLLDMVSEFVQLDYMYDPDQLENEVITLKVHGKLQGKMRVKDLYYLLEAVLKSKGLVMARQKGGLVTLVPVEEALDVDPKLVDANKGTVEAGNMVVTRVFALRHISTSDAANLLDNMRLSIDISPIEDTKTLIVTCYAHRLTRIEQLLDLIDRPGKPRKAHFRQLQYTLAKSLVEKVKTLSSELEIVPVPIASTRNTSSGGPGKPNSPIRPNTNPRSNVGPDVQESTERTVYLDADERTNRILMIGFDDQLATVNDLIDALDVAQQNLRSLKLFKIGYTDAFKVRTKLEELKVIGRNPRTRQMPSNSGLRPNTAIDAVQEAPIEEPLVVVLEATNSLLAEGSLEQLNQIENIIEYVDTAQQDPRTLRLYRILHVDAQEVSDKFTELGLPGHGLPADSASNSISSETPLSSGRMPTGDEGHSLIDNPKVLVLKPTNSLLIRATQEQHIEISNLIAYIDTKTDDHAIPYEIYPLENQQPGHLAEVLEKIILKTTTSVEGKIETVVRNPDEEIVIVPDDLTFSVIVYANKKNQEWVSKLIRTLDKRRPQVLIDVTLVEIRKTEEFSYALNILQSIPNLVETGGQTGSFLANGENVVDKLLQSGSRKRYIDFQANSGAATGFYADTHINALLTAMQTKNYGRVLAKPKILVNDNEKGTIKTTDLTFVTKKSSIPVSSGGAGEQTTLIETALDYEEYEAGITLNITPHIGEGDLLRLQIELTRSDFLPTEGDKPPNQTSSNINTVVTVPDESTIILGGMLKLNQNKGRTKVPILGDLPIVGGLFRSVSNADNQNKLYIFVKAEIIRPEEALAAGKNDLKRISDENRAAFEDSENEFQESPNWPGRSPRVSTPRRVLEAN